MQLSETKLNQIVLEEVATRLLEQIIEEELVKLLPENEDLEAYKQDVKRSIMHKAKKGLLPLTVAASLLGFINQKTTDYADTKAADAEITQQINKEKANTDEAQLEKFADQLNNTARYMWGVGDQGAMPVPGTDGKITVLPPSYSLAVRAFLDKKANAERIASGEEPLMRYGELDLEDIPQIGGDYSYQGSYEENVDNFFNVYTGKDMINAMDVLEKVPELDVVSGTGTEQMIIMVNPDKIDSNYVLPELGMTAADYYNSQYGTFLGTGEKNAMELPDEEMIVTPDDDTEKLDQGLIDATNKKAQQHQSRRMKESKITWKNYKNRKKKLAQSTLT